MHSLSYGKRKILECSILESLLFKQCRNKTSEITESKQMYDALYPGNHPDKKKVEEALIKF